jgi:CheY-like chemotaxis protein
LVEAAQPTMARLDGHHDARDGRLRGDQRHPSHSRLRQSADHRAQREGHPRERGKALASGANEYLQKPVVDLNRLLKIARDALGTERTEKPPTADGDTGDRT